MPKFEKVVSNAEEIISGVCLVAMVLIVIINVFLRYLFSHSLFWAEEVSTILFVWAVFLGASAVYKKRMDIGVDAIVKKCSPETQLLLSHLVRIVLLLINGYIFYMSIVFTSASYGKPTAVLGISSAAVSTALVVSFGLITWHSVRFLSEDIRRAM